MGPVERDRSSGGALPALPGQSAVPVRVAGKTTWPVSAAKQRGQSARPTTGGQSAWPILPARIFRHPRAVARRVHPAVEPVVARIIRPVVPPEMPPLVPPVSPVGWRQAVPEIAVRSPIAVVEIAVIIVVPPVIGIARPGQPAPPIHIIAARCGERCCRGKRERCCDGLHGGPPPVVGTGGSLRLWAAGWNKGMCVWGGVRFIVRNQI